MSGAPTTIGQHQILRELGRGGMGVVYLAHDASLQREVAIKSIPDFLAADADRMARFEREARLLASLSHGNIAGVHGMETHDGRRHIVMEFVPGQTLAHTLASGPMPVEEALSVCAQIAAGVEGAHDAGVIHRDLKPGNIMLRPDGVVKVLDFGLAREAPLSSSRLQTTDDATRSLAQITRANVAIGTPGYMSPEQARGRSVDKRSDIFAFGCVLYECLAGKPVFTGETATDIVVSVLEREPDWTALPQRTPLRVRELLKHCLEKDPARRLRDIGDARLELDRAIAGREWSATSAMPAAGGGPRRRLAHAAAWVVAAAAVAVAALALWQRGPAGGETPMMAVSLLGPEGQRVIGPVISPDGATVAFWSAPETGGAPDGSDRGWRIRRVDSFESHAVPGSHRSYWVAFSTDARWLLFTRPSEQNPRISTLVRARVDNPAAQVAIADIDDWGGDMTPVWLDDGSIVVISGAMGQQRITRVSASGQSMAAPDLHLPSNSSHLRGRSVRSIPGDTTRVLVDISRFPGESFTIGVGLLDITTGGVRILVDNAGGGALLPPDRLVFARADALLSAPVDTRAWTLTGSPSPVLTGLRTTDTWSHARFALSKRGDLLYQPGARIGGDRRIVLLDRQGTIKPLFDEERAFVDDPIISHDRTRLAVTIARAGGLFEIWVTDTDRPAFRRVAWAPGADCSSPSWLHDNRTLLYMQFSGDDERDGLYLVDVDSAAPPRRILALSARDGLGGQTETSPADRQALLTRYTDNAAVLYRLDLSRADQQPELHKLLESPVLGGAFTRSPDGRWLAYSALMSSRFEVVIRRIGDDWSLGPEIPVSSTGGYSPVWLDATDDGRLSLSYITSDAAVRAVAVDIQTAPRVLIGEPSYYPVSQTLSSNPAVFDDNHLLFIQRGDDEAPTRELRLIRGAGPLLRAQPGGARPR